MILQVEPLCKLLIQSRETLTSLELIHCKLSLSSISAICTSLHEKGIHTTGMQRFCIKTSSIEIDPLAAPSAFVSFLMSVRYIYGLMPKRVLLNVCSFGYQRLFINVVILLLCTSFFILLLVSIFFLSGPYIPYIFAIATSIDISRGWFSLHFLILLPTFRPLTSLKTMWVPPWFFLFKLMYGLHFMADLHMLYRFQDGFLLLAAKLLLVLCHLESLYSPCASST